jgi:ketosteroid isomerase-like protein
VSRGLTTVHYHGANTLEIQWLEADKANNPDAVASMMSDEYIATNSEGKLDDKAKTLEQVKTRKYSTAEYEDIRITVFGNTAIARGGFKGSGTEPSGKPFTEHLRRTDTWVKTSGGKRQVVATQYTAVK